MKTPLRDALITAQICPCDPTRGQTCPACDGTWLDDADPRPEPCAYRYPGSPAEYCCEDALDGTPYCGLHVDDPADPDTAYDLYRDTRDLAVA